MHPSEYSEVADSRFISGVGIVVTGTCLLTLKREAGKRRNTLCLEPSVICLFQKTSTVAEGMTVLPTKTK